jgi:hypothetical protein
MWVEVRPGALELGAEEELAVLGLLALCHAGRHTLVGDDDALRAWAGSGAWPAWLGELVGDLLDMGQMEAAVGAPRGRVVVDRGPERWSSTPQLPPGAALGLLSRPLKLLLENGRHDWAFFLAFATEAQARTLEQADAAGWLQRSSGGCGEVKAALTLLVKSLRDAERPAWAEASRTVAVIDADIVAEGHEPKLQKEVAALLRELERALQLPDGSAGAVLQRREIENYIPPAALERWATGFTGDERRQLSRLARALRAIERVDPSASFAGIYDMKQGRGSGAPAPVWTRHAGLRGLSADHRQALDEGLGERLGRSFFDQHRAGLAGAHHELTQLLTRLLERL